MPGWLLQLLSCPGHQQCAAWWPDWPPPHGAAPGGTPHHGPPPALPGLTHKQTAPVPHPPAQCHPNLPRSAGFTIPDQSFDCIKEKLQDSGHMACAHAGWAQQTSCDMLLQAIVTIRLVCKYNLQNQRAQTVGTTWANHTQRPATIRNTMKAHF